MSVSASISTYSDASFKAEGDSAVASAANAQAPLLAQPQTPTSTSPVAAPVTALPVPVAVSESASSVATSILATRTPISTAAFAVPLSIVGAILLVAAVLSLRHNRKLAEERAQDVEKLILSRKSSVASSLKSGFSRQSDIEHALNVLSKAQSQGDVKRMPVPLFMPVEIPFQREARRSTRESYHANQYTEYHRPSQERRHQDKPPSYRSAPLSSPSRPQSRTRSLLSSVSSHSQAPSRTPVHLPSHHYEDREQSNNRTCETSSNQLTPVQVTSPLHYSEHEYSSVQREGRDNWRPRPKSRYETYRGAEIADCATDSVLDDYLFIESAPKPLTFPPSLPKPPQLLSNPPRCLIPAPQRLHVRNSGAVSPMSDNIIEEEEEMTMKEVNLYDVVADSLNRARRY